jgi:hypothetical protein
MKIGIALPHLGSDATKENILKIALGATPFGLLSGFFGL